MSSSPSDFDMSVSESAGGEVRPSRIRRVFLGPSDIRAGWRLAMFILFFAALNFLVIGGSARLLPSFAAMPRLARSGGVLSPQFEVIFEGAQLIAGVAGRRNYGSNRETAAGRIRHPGGGRVRERVLARGAMGAGV